MSGVMALLHAAENVPWAKPTPAPDCAHITADGTSAERKTTIEKLIAEIRLDEDEQVIPVFRISADGVRTHNA